MRRRDLALVGAGLAAIGLGIWMYHDTWAPVSETIAVSREDASPWATFIVWFGMLLTLAGCVQICRKGRAIYVLLSGVVITPIALLCLNSIRNSPLADWTRVLVTPALFSLFVGMLLLAVGWTRFLVERMGKPSGGRTNAT